MAIGVESGEGNFRSESVRRDRGDVRVPDFPRPVEDRVPRRDLHREVIRVDRCVRVRCTVPWERWSRRRSTRLWTLKGCGKADCPMADLDDGEVAARIGSVSARSGERLVRLAGEGLSRRFVGRRRAGSCVAKLMGSGRAVRARVRQLTSYDAGWSVTHRFPVGHSRWVVLAAIRPPWSREAPFVCAR
jgi:hypothetical protein